MVKRLLSKALLPRLLSDPLHDPARGLDLEALRPLGRGELLLVDERQDRLDENGPAHVYRLKAPLGHRLSFVVASSNFRVEMIVTAPSGRRWRVDGAWRAGESQGWREIRLPEEGVYEVLVTSRAALAGSLPAEGIYRLRVFGDVRRERESSRRVLPPIDEPPQEAARYGVSRAVRTWRSTVTKPNAAPDSAPDL